MKDGQYYSISGWMGKYLGLRANDLICFAVIYGFSMDGESQFKGNLDYLSSCMFASRPTVLLSLKHLIEHNLILKHDDVVNGKKRCYYSTNVIYDEGDFDVQDTSKEPLSMTSKEPLPKTSKGALPKEYNNKEDNKKENKSVSNDTQKVDDEQFLEFWEKYGYKKNRKGALSAFNKLNKKDKKAAIEAIGIYKEDCRRNKRQMQHPATYLNKRTWEDDFDTDGRVEEQEEEQEQMPAGLTSEKWHLAQEWLNYHCIRISGFITPTVFVKMRELSCNDSKLFTVIIKEIEQSDFSGDMLKEFTRLINEHQKMSA